MKVLGSAGRTWVTISKFQVEMSYLFTITGSAGVPKARRASDSESRTGHVGEYFAIAPVECRTLGVDAGH